MMKRIFFFAFTATSILNLSGCASTPQQQFINLTDIQAVSLCQVNEQALEIEQKITAEHGFKRFAKNTYRPIVEQLLFGHQVRVINLEPTATKVYVAGNPLEFGHHFSALIPNISCANNSCQAPINEQQTLHI